MNHLRTLVPAAGALVLTLLPLSAGQATATPRGHQQATVVATTAPAPEDLPNEVAPQSDSSVAAPCSFPSIRHQTVELGDVNRFVRHAQCLLNKAWGYPLAIDGIFGPRTERAVLQHQDDCDISVDGIVGPVTWDRLHSDSTSRECRDGDRR